MPDLSTKPPDPVARVADLMATFERTWALCGGWAVDAWLGRTSREHHDVDVAVFQEDQRALFDHLAGWRLVGHDDNVDDDSEEPWNGRVLEFPAHVHSRAEDGFLAEFHLNERAGGDWVLRREPCLAVPIERAVRPSPWGLPAVSPEVVLYYKALPLTWRNTPRAAPRERDERDLDGLLPRLAREQRDWLREAVGGAAPGHPWLARLEA